MASFAGVDNPFTAGRMPVGGRVLDLGSGGGLDCFVAAEMVGPTGQVIGVYMTPEMLERSRREAAGLGLRNVEFRAGILEQLPVPDGWADVVISNGVLNLVADKVRVLREALRALRPGGVIQFADIAVGRSVSDAARCDIELWTDCIAGGLSVDAWAEAIVAAGFGSVSVGFPTDSFAAPRANPGRGPTGSSATPSARSSRDRARHDPRRTGAGLRGSHAARRGDHARPCAGRRARGAHR